VICISDTGFNLAKAQAGLYGYTFDEQPEPKKTDCKFTGVNPETWKLIQADAARADKIRRGGVDLAQAQAELYGYGWIP